MYRSIQAAVIAAVLAACSGPAGQYEPGNDGIVVPAGACAINPPDLSSAERLSPFGSSSGCGITEPWRLSAVSNVRLSEPATLSCNTVSPLHGWLTDIVQPAAARAFGEPVASIHVAASYDCRSRNGNPGAKLSEHGHGNAIDISGFTLASGREVTVAAGWYGGDSERAFLREVHDKACGRFSTVLGPASDTYHRDHIHLDIQPRKSGKPFCR